MTDQDVTNGGIVKEDQIVSKMNVEETIEWATAIFQTLFELEKKYSKSIKKKEVVDVREAEEDRSKVSDAYLYLKTQKENLLDSALYEDFIDMNELREISYLEQILLPEQRLADFARTIAKLSQAVFYTASQNRIRITNVAAIISKEVIDLESKEALQQFIMKYQDFVTPLKNIRLSKGDIMNLESGIISKLAKERIKKDELEDILTTAEAEVLSKMISEKKIQVIQVGENELIFAEIDKDNGETGISSSVLLSPKMKKAQESERGWKRLIRRMLSNRNGNQR